MKYSGKITLSNFDSSGEGTVTYTTTYGSVLFEYGEWGKFIYIPTPEKWITLYADSWAADQRANIIQDLAKQVVNPQRPDFKMSANCIEFFNAQEIALKDSEAIADATSIQSPTLDRFIESFQNMPDQDKAQTVVWVMDIVKSSVSSESAECVISDVLYGPKDLIGAQLKLGFQAAVPILSGRKYITRESESIIRQYVNTRHRWRCFLHVEQIQSEVEAAKNYFSAINHKSS